MTSFVIRVLRFLAIVLCVGVAGLSIFPHFAIRLGSWLAVESQYLVSGSQTDAIIVLGGNTLERTSVGVDLYHRSVAPLIALTGYGADENIPEFDETLIARDRALAADVPAQSFTLLKTTSTLEDAQQIASYARQHRLTEIVVVSDWTHARRAVCTIQAEIGSSPPAIFFFPSSTKYSPANWWTSERSLVDTFTEVAKLGYYAIRYGIPMWGCFYGDPDIFTIAILSGLGFIVSIVSVEWVRRNALRLNRIDVPNERSSHIVPTPRGGGLGIGISVIGLWLGFVATFSEQIDFPLMLAIGFPLAAVCVASIGWSDDRHSHSSRLRLFLYALVCGGFVAAVGAFTYIELPLIGTVSIVTWAAAALTLLWLVGFLNIFNFMDGIDGLAGNQAFIAGIFWLLISLLEGQLGLLTLSGLIAAASLGFLVHNAHPARIFMGDVGSAFLGFALAAMPLMVFVQTGNARLPVVGGLFVAPFVLDGLYTITRRAIRRENIFKAHRSHVYQKLVIAGKTHAQVTREYRTLMLFGGLCGLIYYAATPIVMLFSLLITVTTFVLYGWWALKLTNRA